MFTNLLQIRRDGNIGYKNAWAYGRCLHGCPRYLQLSLPLTNSSASPPVGRRQTYQPLAPGGICCEQEIVSGPSAALKVQSTLQVTARSDALSVLTIMASFAGDHAQE